MTPTSTAEPAQTGTDHVDVLIVGAGISGIGAGRYLRTLLPHKSFTILEARGSLGGTWDLFRYPGIRSDSDLHTFGYEFKPWRDEQSIADGARILDYLRETATENGLDDTIRYHHRVVGGSWSSAQARWTVQVERTDTGEHLELTADWIFSAAGYYRYDEGFTPEFPGRDRFQGTVVHPQHWPEDLDYAGKRVVVIGSGATAVTLIPAMAETAAHVTMLQRTPTYILPVPRKDPIANALKRLFGDERGYALTRRKNIAQQKLVWSLSQKYPDRMRRIIRWTNAKQLPAGYPVDEHFNPPYNPWEQRLCTVPDGDLFRSIRNGTASVVTDRIDTFTENGIRLTSGRELEADIIVTATGLNVQAFGGVPVTIDGRTVAVSDTVAYKGLMLSGVPNLAYAIGYTNSSWTLKIGLLCEHFCRVLAHMDDNGYRIARAEIADTALSTRPFLDFAAGYIQRVVDQLPSQGDRMPWRTSMNYQDDVKLLREADVLDPELHFETAHQPARRTATVPA
ncbi:NAD(P)/FAD-dependent oxidoreductase [Nocardia sp. NPDC051833]|uniref:flavin-containing monooxygenase n=1 Tax=Nocardia sp. NPDC051833 TaxID=3155674 RepID=UPI003447D43B